MDFRALSPEQREAMLRAVGVSGEEGLFADLPTSRLLDGPLERLGEPMEEMELAQHLASLAATDEPATEMISFMGAGTYDHYTPSIVDHVLRRPEIFTAYTPYQPEVSQGTLQAIFEFQTAVCELTGMEVANAGMYDGATAAVEALFMACRLKKKHHVLVSSALHPQWIETIRTYCDLGVVEAQFAPTSELIALLSDEDATRDLAGVLVPSPDFLGRLVDLEPIADAVHEAGALLIAAVNPLLQAVVETPGERGADIVVGEGQPLGLPMNFGGPGIGLFACKQAYTRQMPGRICGQAVDSRGEEGFVLTLSTREQHIRREKATSNICSNQTLCATGIGVYLAAMGRTGLVETATTCVSNAHYLREQLIKTGCFLPVNEDGDAPFGYEFALRFKEGMNRDREFFDASLFVERMKTSGILAGVLPDSLEATYDSDLIVFAVTEKRTKGDIDYFVSEVEAQCK